MKRFTLFALVVFTLAAAMLSTGCVVGQNAEQGKANGLSHEQKKAVKSRNAKDGCNQHTGYVGY